MVAKGKEIYEFADFSLDVSERLLMRNGRRVPLADKPFEVLCVLVRGNGHLVGKDELFSRVWGGTIVEENNLDKSISTLRSVLGHRKGRQKFIETVRGHGYRFVYDVRRVEFRAIDPIENRVDRSHEVATNAARHLPGRFNYSANSPNVVALADWHVPNARENVDDREDPLLVVELPSGSEVDNVPYISPKLWNIRSVLRGRGGLAIFALAILLTFASGSYFYYFSTSSRITSVAVLPFVNSTQDPNAEYLSDGITESIINTLSRLPDLRVMSRNSAFKFRGDLGNTQHIASQLGVETLITGDIKQLGEKLVINVRLIDVRDDSHVWGDQYVEAATDIIKVQNKIAQDISRILGAQLSRTDEKRESNHAIDPEAYRSYLKGRHHSERFTVQDTRKAISHFQQAIEIDPKYAAAYASLAAAYAGISGSKEFPRRETIAKARENVLQALALDDQLPTAHEVYGYILFNFDYSFAAAEREFRRALELDPNDSSARETFGGLLSALGRNDEALAQVQYAKEINPLSPSICASHGLALMSAGRLDEAADEFNAALELNARYVQAVSGLAIVYQLQGNFAQSVEQRAKVIELLGDVDGAAFVRDSYARGGWSGFLRDMTDNSQAPTAPSYVIVSYYVELGEKDKAFATLNKMYDEGSPSLVRLKVDPRYEPLRSDPRFTQILNRLNLQ